MKLSVLGSSSSGNSYVLHNENEALIIECGIKPIEIKKTIGFDYAKINGIIVSHSDQDHIKFIDEYLNLGIDVYTSAGTIEETKTKSNFSPIVCKHGSEFRIGEFTVLPFDTQHDCKEPLGFLINHPECGNVLFATDTYYLKYKFNELRHILIECNYSEEILQRNGVSNEFLKNRTINSHMSYETCCSTLIANDLSLVQNIVLIHLSDRNSDANMFRHGICELTNKNVYIADSGLEIELNKTPF